jgi:NAD(P)H-flavin reductase
MHAAPLIHQEIQKKSPKESVDIQAFQDHFKAEVHSILPLTPYVTELQIHAPHHARTFQPGQYFKVLPFPSFSKSIPPKPLALTGIKAEGELLTLLLVGHHPINRWCHALKAGDPISLMGPNGTPTPIPIEKRVALIGSGLGHAIFRPIMKAMKEKGCNIDYIAYAPTQEPIYYADDLRAASCTFHVYPSITEIQNLLNHSSWDYGLIIGPRDLIKALKETPEASQFDTAVMTNFFCMMHGLCGACVQRHVNEKGEESWVFTCQKQEQPITTLDFNFLENKLYQK